MWTVGKLQINFCKNLPFKQNLNSQSYETKDLWIIEFVAFVFCSTGMGRWCKEIYFFFSATEKEERRKHTLPGRMEKIN